MNNFRSNRAANPVLAKAEVGRARPITHDLPGRDHNFGVAYKKDEFDVAATLHGWNETHQKKVVKDVNFMKLNRMTSAK